MKGKGIEGKGKRKAQKHGGGPGHRALENYEDADAGGDSSKEGERVLEAAREEMERWVRPGPDQEVPWQF